MSNILELRGITKAFPGVVALNGVDLEIAQGEVHALLGENGAGKSSLIKVLCGIYLPDRGEMQYAGAKYAPRTPHDAIAAGIRVVYQEFNLLSYLSIAENIFFDKLPRKMGLVDFRTLYRETEKLLALVGLALSPKTPVELLGIAQMQLIEIAKALSGQSKVLILDEPTATLTSKEIDTLFGIIKRLQAEGVTIIYVSHRLQEVFEIGDRFTVLRNGMKVGTKALQGVTVPEIVKQVFAGLKLNDFELRLDGTYEPWVYCVQYRESDFNFVSRLLEEEGIFYFFEHGPSLHKLVLADAPGRNPACPDQPTAEFDPGSDRH